MQFAFSRALLACAFLASFAFAAAKQQQQQQQQKPLQQNAAPPKLKRDAGLSFGSGIYHGPSHKYLPPAASGGYESTYATLHGNGLASSSGFDFASLDTDNSQHQYHHYSHQPHTYQSLASHHGHGRPVYISSAGGGSAGGYHHRPQAPKVETYIVQTSGGHGHGHQGHGAGNGLGGGYKYSGHGSGFYSLLGGGGGGGSGGGSNIGHKQHGGISSTYLLSTPSYSSSSSSGGGGGSSIHGLGHGHGHHSSIGSIGSIGNIGSISSSHGLGHGLNLGAHHFAPALSHGLEHEEHTGYNYEAPSVHYKQPLSSYGVPLLPGYEHGQHGVEQELHHEEQHLPHAQPQQVSEHKSPGDQQPPAYALGHKGLGHFSYTSSKPLALNTDIHHLGAGAHEDHNELVAELSKVPFKPSAFLGAKHEPSAGYDYATPSTQYLQGPTAGGYDYPAPAVLYGAPGQSGDSATPIFEPESTYLPPVSSYGAPATPTHGYP